jgi:diguanylate cyclase (GGDEF)-like protein/PAS domain S-box-containing protein
LRAEALRALPLFAAVAALALAALWPLIAALARAVRRANELSKRSHARFVMAAESVYETFTTLDCVRDGDGSIIDFRFTFCTEGHTARHGTSRTDMVGRCLSELFPDYRASGVFDRYRRVVDTGEPFVKEIEVSDPETMAKWIEMHVVRHGDGVAVTTSDISERKLFDGVQRESETRFRLLAENSQDMIFRIDTDGTVLYASPAARAIFGCDPDALVAQRLEQWAHPDDAERFADLLTSLMVGGIKDAALVQRMRASEGDWRWIELQMHAITDGASGVSEIQGALRDIGARHAAEEAVRANEARLVAATESIHDSFTVYEAVRDGNGAVVDFRYSFINAAGARSLGRPAQELQGRLLCELNPRARASGFFAQCQRVLESGESCSGELRLERAGEEVWVDLKIVRVGDRGEVAVTYRDISERKRAELLLQESEARMRQMAHYDGLTHLPNRMLFFERLGEAMARAYRAEHPLVVMFIDVDHFKQFNDTYGHAGGDEVLRVVARRLSAAVRSSDTVARFAGDEFTIILESIRSLAEARVVGIKLLEAMRAPIRLGAEEVRVTLSVGAAYLERETVSADALVHVADAALYEVKQNGRNGFHASVVGSAAEIAAKEALYRQLLQP